jgi:hypothetical protein
MDPFGAQGIPTIRGVVENPCRRTIPATVPATSRVCQYFRNLCQIPLAPRGISTLRNLLPHNGIGQNHHAFRIPRIEDFDNGTTTQTHPLKSPLWRIMGDCIDTMSKIGGKFGLTPSDRGPGYVGAGGNTQVRRSTAADMTSPTDTGHQFARLVIGALEDPEAVDRNALLVAADAFLNAAYRRVT